MIVMNVAFCEESIIPKDQPDKHVPQNIFTSNAYFMLVVAFEFHSFFQS